MVFNFGIIQLSTDHFILGLNHHPRLHPDIGIRPIAECLPCTIFANRRLSIQIVLFPPATNTTMPPRAGRSRNSNYEALDPQLLDQSWVPEGPSITGESQLAPMGASSSGQQLGLYITVSGQ
jgi:hypothetical protein